MTILLRSGYYQNLEIVYNFLQVWHKLSIMHLLHTNFWGSFDVASTLTLGWKYLCIRIFWFQLIKDWSGSGFLWHDQKLHQMWHVSNMVFAFRAYPNRPHTDTHGRCVCQCCLFCSLIKLSCAKLAVCCLTGWLTVLSAHSNWRTSIGTALPAVRSIGSHPEPTQREQKRNARGPEHQKADRHNMLWHGANSSLCNWKSLILWAVIHCSVKARQTS